MMRKLMTIGMAAIMLAMLVPMSAPTVVASDSYSPIEFTSEPSVSNIISTVDGRTITASVVADNYSTIVWDMGDGTIYEGVTSVRHTYADDGDYTIRVTVSDLAGRVDATEMGVQIGDVAEGGLGELWASYGLAALIIIGVGLVVAYLLGLRHPLVIVLAAILLIVAAMVRYGVI